MTAADGPVPDRHHRSAGFLALFGGTVLAVGVVFGATAGVGSIWSATSASGSSAPAQPSAPTASTSAPASQPAAPKASATSATTSGQESSGAADVVAIVLQLDDTSGPAGTITGRPGWPRYSPSSITVPAGKQVTLVITNYDDAATPLTAALASYNQVQGGTETVNGATVTSVSNKVIAHTFTSPELGVNIPVPLASDAGSGSNKTVVPAVVTFTFTPSKTGTFTWQCFTPCGSGSDGTAGPMATLGFMKGTITVA